MKVKERVKKLASNSTFKTLRSCHLVPSLTSWQIHREKVETVSGFIFLGFKINADGDCSMKLKDACSSEEKL